MLFGLSYPTLLLVVAFGQLAFGPSKIFAVSVGIELEYASATGVQPNSELIPPDRYKAPLQIVRSFYGGRGSRIRTRNIGSEPRRTIAGYTDPYGRHWKVVPESVNTTGYDGFELVAPKSGSQNQDNELKRIVRQIETSGEFAKGLKSSAHFTVDVGHLIKKSGECPKLWDLIVFLENHWPEIYAVFNPQRSGAFVNRFAVPLGLDHPELVKQIARVPRSERTLDALRSLFEKFEASELRLAGGDASKAWKYRAGNYKKLLGLLGATQVNVIEIRIGDLVESGEIPGRSAFLRKLFTMGAEAEPSSKFVNPFHGMETRPLQSVELNERILHRGRSRHSKLCATLNLDESDYPAFGGKHLPLRIGLSDEQLARLEAKLDLSQPIVLDGGYATAGFEAEFRGPREQRLFLGDKVNRARFPYLSEDSSTEGTGNREVRSVPSLVFERVFEEMEEIASVLRADLRSFHFHFRIPLAAWEKIPAEEKEGWIARISDAIAAWRLENRRHFFTFKTFSSGAYGQEGGGRATLRRRQVADTEMSVASIDFEIRGYMTSLRNIRSLVREMLIGIKNPELIRGFAREQKQLSTGRNLVVEMESFAKDQYARRLSSRERGILEDIQGSIKPYLHFPLLGFELAPFLSFQQAQRVKEANYQFKRSVMALLDKARPYNDMAAVDRSFRARIQRWARNLGFAEMLRGSVLVPPRNAAKGGPIPDPFQSIQLHLASGSEEGIAQASEELDALDPVAYKTTLDRLLALPDEGLHLAVLKAIHSRPLSESRAIYESLAVGKSELVGNQAVAKLAEGTSLPFMLARANKPGFDYHCAERWRRAIANRPEYRGDARAARRALLDLIDAKFHVSHGLLMRSTLARVVSEQGNNQEEAAEYSVEILNAVYRPQTFAAGLTLQWVVSLVPREILRQAFLKNVGSGRNVAASVWLLRYLSKGDPALTQKNLEALADSSSPKIRMGVLDLLWERDGPGAFRILEKLGGDRSSVIRARVAHRLGFERGSFVAIGRRERSLFRALVQDPHIGVSNSAISELLRARPLDVQSNKEILSVVESRSPRRLKTFLRHIAYLDEQRFRAIVRLLHRSCRPEALARLERAYDRLSLRREIDFEQSRERDLFPDRDYAPKVAVTCADQVSESAE